MHKPAHQSVGVYVDRPPFLDSPACTWGSCRCVANAVTLVQRDARTHRMVLILIRVHCVLGEHTVQLVGVPAPPFGLSRCVRRGGAELVGHFLGFLGFQPLCPQQQLTVTF